MPEAAIVATARTPIGKAFRGAFNNLHGATLGSHSVRAAVERAGIDPAEVTDLMLGVARPEGATGNLVARQVVLRAGLPDSVAAISMDRKCSSGLQAIAFAAQRIRAGEGGVLVAGGLESNSLVERNRNMIHYEDEWLAANRPEIVRYDTRASDDVVLGLGLGCQGLIDVLLEPLAAGPLSDAIAFYQRLASHRVPVELVTSITDDAMGRRQVRTLDGHHLDGERELGAGAVAIEVVKPAVPLVVCGAGADAQGRVRAGRAVRGRDSD